MTKSMWAAIVLPVCVFVMAACGAQQGGNANSQGQLTDTADMADAKAPVITFDTAVFNFGRILQGEQVSTVFTFENTGNADLVIKRVETSCGCTVPEYDKAPVAPGKKGSIRVRFDSDGKEGSQYKVVKVTSNCVDNIFELVVTGEVEVR